MKYVLLLALMLTSIHNAKGQPDESTHLWAHIGTSYIVSNIVYQTMHKGFGAPKLTSFLFACISTLAISASYKYISPGTQLTGFETAMKGTGIGIGLQGLTVLVFE